MSSYWRMQKWPLRPTGTTTSRDLPRVVDLHKDPVAAAGNDHAKDCDPPSLSDFAGGRLQIRCCLRRPDLSHSTFYEGQSCRGGSSRSSQRPLHGSQSAPLSLDGSSDVELVSDDRLGAMMRSGRVRLLSC